MCCAFVVSSNFEVWRCVVGLEVFWRVYNVVWFIFHLPNTFRSSKDDQKHKNFGVIALSCWTNAQKGIFTISYKTCNHFPWNIYKRCMRIIWINSLNLRSKCYTVFKKIDIVIYIHFWIFSKSLSQIQSKFFVEKNYDDINLVKKYQLNLVHHLGYIKKISVVSLWCCAFAARVMLHFWTVSIQNQFLT